MYAGYNARMYVQSTEARRRSHCCEQFERRADLPEEEVDVLFLQYFELKHGLLLKGIAFVIVCCCNFLKLRLLCLYD